MSDQASLVCNLSNMFDHPSDILGYMNERLTYVLRASLTPSQDHGILQTANRMLFIVPLTLSARQARVRSKYLKSSPFFPPFAKSQARRMSIS